MDSQDSKHIIIPRVPVKEDGVFLSFQTLSEDDVRKQQINNAAVIHFQHGSYDDVIKWKHFPRYWPFVRGIHRSRCIPHRKASDAEL